MTDVEFRDLFNNVGCPDIADRGYLKYSDLPRLEEAMNWFSRHYDNFREHPTGIELQKSINVLKR